MNVNPFHSAPFPLVHRCSNFFGKLKGFLITKLKNIKPYFLKIAYTLAHKMTKGNQSKLFKIKIVQLDLSLGENKIKRYFGKDFMGGAYNVARPSVVVNKKDYRACVNLIEKCREDKSIRIDPSKNFDIPLEGICMGISLDTAQRYLIKNESIEKIVKSHRKGGSAEAVANQAVYSQASYEKEYSAFFLNILNDLQEISASGVNYPYFKTSFFVVRCILCLLDPHLSLADPASPSGRRLVLKNSYIKDLINEEIRLCKGQEKFESKWLRPDENYKDSWAVKNPSEFHRAALHKINEKYRDAVREPKANQSVLIRGRAEEINQLNWVVSFLEYKQALMPQASKETCKINGRNLIPALCQLSNPFIRSALLLIMRHHFDHVRLQAIARARDLDIKSVQKVMGHCSAHANNGSYLQNISKLRPGIYLVTFYSSETKGHAINYIKLDENKGFILDSNFMQIQCGDATHTMQQFQKILSFYSQPEYIKKSKFAILKTKTLRNHLLHFWEITKGQAKEESSENR
ncbi:hypothetical protein [Parachlamydia sp. AcF125]|uniref:hypothetical protein n=1 Tax=Parachlamydia sp. AcF125 TaxID=2795736 RepID=UPI001BC8E60C|nr:hypothetical protein [Parachlamydia sp. AcF125]MBS4168640.1 hypothetical protein [Parachlamydia sp. AcF125]